MFFSELLEQLLMVKGCNIDKNELHTSHPQDMLVPLNHHAQNHVSHLDLRSHRVHIVSLSYCLLTSLQNKDKDTDTLSTDDTQLHELYPYLFRSIILLQKLHVF